MESVTWSRFLLLTGGMLLMAIHGVYAECVTEKMSDVKTCFDTLKTNMETEAPSDVNSFLCGDDQKPRLDCVIKHFNECPDFSEESFIEGLKHSASGFHAMDLFHVDSADEFCKCAPTFTCLEKVETEKVGADLDHGPWTRVANQEYICGHGRINIDCVAKSLPSCMDYLQYKHNKSVEENTVARLDISSLQYASDYADRQCKTWPDEGNDHSCTMDRAGWNNVDVCHNQMAHLADDNDKICGMRTCIEKAMGSCAAGEMDYFIDAVNVFSETKISTTKCNSASQIVPILTTFILCLLCILF